jgi:hypothetical protein
MGLFAPKTSEIESVLLVHGGNRLKVHELIYTSKSGHDWSKASRGWVVAFYFFAQSDLENINKFWLNVLKGERRIVLALNELAAYYIFRTFQIGNDDFLNYNKIDRTTFINEVSEILNLTENNRISIGTYIKNYGAEATRKYFEAPQFTEELGEEFSALITKEIGELLGNIAKAVKDIDDIPLPDLEAIKKIEKSRSNNGIVFKGILEQYKLLANK